MDVKAVIDNSKMSWLQYTTVFICFLMNMLDGMDVLIISYTAPSIADEWMVSAEALGIVFSAGLFGMTMGSMFIAPKTDIIGRKNMILISAAIMGVTIFLTSIAGSVYELVAFRFCSGLGIGSMLASTPALTSEYTPHKTKDFWVSLVMSGYPSGAVVSGIVAAFIVPEFGWRTMYEIAGIGTLLTIPLIWFFLAESLDFLFKSGRDNALEHANKILDKMSLPLLEKMPEVSIEKAKAKLSSLLTENFKKSTIKLWISFFMAFMVLYYLTSWIPKLTVETGLTIELGIYAGTVFNLGSIAGIILQGYLSGKFGLRKTICVFLVVSAILMMIFGFFNGPWIILILFGLIGFAQQGGFVGIYAVAARMYPTEIRTTGIGWAIGAGRLGAIFGPLIGGYLLGAGLSITMNFIIFAVPAIVAGIAILFIQSSEVT